MVTSSQLREGSLITRRGDKKTFYSYKKKGGEKRGGGGAQEGLPFLERGAQVLDARFSNLVASLFIYFFNIFYWVFFTLSCISN